MKDPSYRENGPAITGSSSAFLCVSVTVDRIDMSPALIWVIAEMQLLNEGSSEAGSLVRWKTSREGLLEL